MKAVSAPQVEGANPLIPVGAIVATNFLKDIICLSLEPRKTTRYIHEGLAIKIFHAVRLLSCVSIHRWMGKYNIL